MRVLMLTPDAQMIDRRILQEAQVLRAQGHEVVLLAGFECREEEHYEQDGIAIHRYVYDWDDERLKTVRQRIGNRPGLHKVVNRVFMAFLRRFLRLTSFERFIVEKGLGFPADVVHCHDLPVLRAGRELGRLWNVPVVFDAHELYHAQETFPPALRARLLRDEKDCLPGCAAVVTVNEFIAAELHRIHGVPMPWVVYNSCEPPPREVVEGRRGTLRERVPGDGPIVLFQGWISAERNIETVVRAMEFVPEPAQLAVIGYGEFEAELRRIAEERGIASRVHFLGRVPSEEMLGYTVQADLGVIPYLPIDLNHRFCSPNKFFEYTLSGVPVLAHELPFFEAMRARHGVVECTDLADPEATGRKIGELLEGDRLAELRTRCLEARDRLAWHNDAERLRQIYAGLSVR